MDKVQRQLSTNYRKKDRIMLDINFDNIEKGTFIKESIHILHDAYISKNSSYLYNLEQTMILVFHYGMTP